MRIAFLVSAVADEKDIYTTTALAREAARRGHDVAYVDIDGLTVAPDGRMHAVARHVRSPHDGPADFLRKVVATVPEPLAVEKLDVLMLRNTPAFDALRRPWAQPVGHLFGELARRSGVVVLSDPRGLALAGPDKLYTLRFPERLRPRTLITRDVDAVREFVGDLAGDAILKPLHGCCGQGVFLLVRGDPNVRPIFEAVAAHGYAVVQEYLPANERGSHRLFMLDGEPLTAGGSIAAMRLLPRDGEIRSNFGVAGTIAAPDPDDGTAEVLHEIAEAAGPVLAADGMFLAALDIVGGKILEAGLWSPGGLRGAQRLAGADFVGAVIDAVTGRLAAAGAEG
ncbi:glutathione synthase [Actinomadura sp. KC216]|uniref:glutathione synthase n=1 Tax=Actinomadura sp. KC216 TaxID=2530370 RepID=UPI00140498AE|nr:glutathione synthase [Actinomadura sp. KC216]